VGAISAENGRKSLTRKVPQSGQKWEKVKHKKMVKKSSDPKRGLNQGNRPKPEPKRPVKQPTPKIGKHPKCATPKMFKMGSKAIRTCNIPHSEAVKAKDSNAWAGTHEKFHNTCQTHSGKSRTAQSRDLAEILPYPNPSRPIQHEPSSMNPPA
jgi:hypothetical protein